MSKVEITVLEESVFDSLNAIRAKPGFYIGNERSLKLLHAFWGGYDAGLGRTRHRLRDSDIFRDFHDWVAKKLGYAGSASGWCNMILERCDNDDAKAYHRFFELLDEFCIERGVKVRFGN